MAGTLFTPKNMEKGKKYQAIIVGHPMGAVKEQSSHLYATKLSEMGFVTLAIDLSFWGESAALNPQSPRNAVLPDMYVEDFLAAVDYLGTRDFIDRDKIGVLGICGSGSFSLAAAKIDSRIKAVATVSMYDMGDANRHGLKNSTTQEQRKAAIEAASNERYSEFLSGKVNRHTSGTPLRIDVGSHPVAKEFYDFYRTKRGEYTPLGAKRETTTMPTLTSNVKFLNFYPFEDLDSISTPLLFVAGDKAHSLEFSQKAYKKAGANKELYLVKDAGHVDLYDRSEIIPFDKLEKFFKENLK